MKKGTKSRLCVALAVLMALAAVPALMFGSSAAAPVPREEPIAAENIGAVSGDYNYDVISEAAKTCKITLYTGMSGTVTIPDKIDSKYTVTAIGEKAFSATNLTSVVIPGTMEVIAKDAFYNCPNLKEITIPKGVIEVGANAVGFTHVSGAYAKIAGFKIFTYDYTAGAKYASTYGFALDYLDGGDNEATSISITPATVALDVSDAAKVSAQLNAAFIPASVSNQVVRWKSSNENVAYVGQDGVVHGVNNGTATITATSANSLKTATRTVTVTGGTVAATGVKFTFVNDTEIIVRRTYRYEVKFELTPADTTEAVTITASPTGFISQPEKDTTNGKYYFTADAVGIATLTIKVGDGAGPKTATIKVNVQNPIAVTGVKFTYAGADGAGFYIDYGNQYAIKVETIPSNATNQNVTLSSSDENIAKFNVTKLNLADAAAVAAGRLIPGFNGTAKITVTTEDGNKTATATVITRGNTATVPVTKVELTPATLNLNYKDAATLEAKVTPDHATNKKVTWKSDNVKIATVDENGKVTAVGAGTAKITATSAADSTKKAECTVTVKMQWWQYIVSFFAMLLGIQY
ncbi:MAG: Ig-like domain-containing protein [Oscillospiraceae bacterium]|nr:Ig-like domain-containing protein [Oscillospiraceae bacterium]